MNMPSTSERLAPEYSGKLLLTVLLRILAVAAMLVTFLGMIPFSPGIGSGSEAWTVVMNEAVARHLVIGRDIVFTFGPFASVYTQLYHPATYPIMLVGSAILALGLCAGFVLLSFEQRPVLLILLPVVVAVTSTRDAIFMAIPFLLMLVCFRAALPPGSKYALDFSGRRATYLGIVACAVGILPLIKVSFLGLAFIAGFASVIMLILAKRFRLVLVIVVVAAAATLLGWVWSGQPITGIVQYVLAQRSIVSGYSEGMAVNGPFSEVVYWFVSAAIITAAFYVFIAKGRGLTGLIALAGLVLYLIVTFKAGFVRQDLHQHTASATLLFVALALGAMLERPRALVVALVAVIGWFGIEQSLSDFNRHFIAERLASTYGSVATWLPRRLVADDSLPTNYSNVKSIEHTQNTLNGVTGTADVYPTRLDILFMNDIPWAGRPVIQSYSAYRPVLDQLNADHLTGAAAPDNVFLAVTPIDFRLPTLEDALSWGIFLTNYSIVGQQLNLIQMKKTLPPKPTTSTPLFDADAKTNEAIAVPPTDGIVIARINMRPTLLGQAVLAAYKLPQVYIDLTLTSGKTVRFRYIPEMGTTGFVLSPLVASNADFVAMAAGKFNQPVKSIQLVSSSNLLWKHNIHVTLETLHVKPQLDAQAAFSGSK
ncbi:hypothetical protein [Paraburkholderia sp. BCC1886]|uniref:hypothetical protein n=1 Tax=Paraburkholderia sp. BCC1886 TaxID=2562670 RepID=UPI00118290F4|nr:hypothetical protein [Paraburkholderia sp. BCC1886]